MHCSSLSHKHQEHRIKIINATLEELFSNLLLLLLNKLPETNSTLDWTGFFYYNMFPTACSDTTHAANLGWVHCSGFPHNERGGRLLVLWSLTLPVVKHTRRVSNWREEAEHGKSSRLGLEVDGWRESTASSEGAPSEEKLYMKSCGRSPVSCQERQWVHLSYLRAFSFR